MKFINILIVAIAFFSCDDESTSSQKISSGSAESVYLTHDHEGSPVVVWTEKSQDRLELFFSTSHDDGVTFEKRVAVALDASVATHAESMPKVAFKNDGTVIIAYEKKAPTQANKYAGAVYYRISTDGGQSWTKEQYIHNDTVSGRSRSYFDLETLPNGEVGAAWLDIKLNEKTGGRSVRFAMTDPTNSFVNEILVDSSACQCCRLDVYTDVRSNVYVAYRGLKKETMGKDIRDMMIATSTDEGKTFGRPMIISGDNWNIDGCPHTGPSLCSNKAGLFAMWYTEGSGTGVYYSRKSEDGFTKRQLVSADGHHPQASANDNIIAMLWEDNVSAGDKTITMLNYKLLKEGNEIEERTLTPTEHNAFLPVVRAVRSGFVVAYLMEVDERVGAYVTRL